ncbi:MAG: CAP domain-containing protein [Acidimicrobiia bacterium]
MVAAALAMLMAAPAAAAPEPTPSPDPAPWSAVTLTDSSIDSYDRASVRAAYDQDYVPLIDSLTFPSSPWTGSVAGCDPGSVPASVRDDLLAAVNFYRALADLAPVTRDSGLDADAQAAALIMDANGALSHQPPSSWDCWTQSGYDGAANSNLYLFPPGQTDFLIEASKGFMDDPGSGNTAVGHRRWILSPAPRPFGFGVTGRSYAMWVTGGYPDDGHVGAPEHIAWPTAGFFPIELSTTRWSLSHSRFLEADLTGADVSMSFEGSRVQISQYNDATNYGFLPTVSWDVTDPRFDDWLEEGRDLTFEIEVTGVDIDGSPTSHDYTVTMAGAWEAGATEGTFADDDGSPFEADIEAIAAAGITLGCNPPFNTRFCPDETVTRGQMAAFLRRALEGRIQPGAAITFGDDNTSVFETDIEWLAATGITLGCAPNRFCPDDTVTRGQMAAFLRRAMEGSIPAGAAITFGDDNTSVFETDIEWLAATGITLGCAPDRFCPDDTVTRGQMAAFLNRAGLASGS